MIGLVLGLNPRGILISNLEIEHMSETLKHIRHLYNRAGFGLSASQMGQLSGRPVMVEARRLCEQAVDNKPLEVLDQNPFEEYAAQQGSMTRMAMVQMIQKDLKASSKQIPDLNVEWMHQMVDHKTLVREKLTLFWHDHFSVRLKNGYLVQQHNNTLRTHAMGKYGDLLLAVAKDPAMLLFLNNQQNRKKRPNENFARELLELYTLGRGHYSESDVKNAARAFTGWTFNRVTGEFQFRPGQHDFGPKQFMGRQGDLDGDDIINILLGQEQTARFLATKLYHFYVSDSPDEDVISSMAARLKKTDYDMADLLEYMFTADWFYEDRFIQNKIKSPVELINNLRIQLGLSFQQPRALIYLERVLGQVLFFPPSVNGWPMGREWIDSSSLINRMRLPAALAKGSELGLLAKDDGDDNNPIKISGERSFRTALMDWKALDRLTEDSPNDEQMIAVYAEFLLNQELPEPIQKAMLGELKKKKEQDKKPWLATTIAGLPEYQLS